MNKFSVAPVLHICSTNENTQGGLERARWDAKVFAKHNIIQVFAKHNIIQGGLVGMVLGQLGVVWLRTPETYILQQATAERDF